MTVRDEVWSEVLTHLTRKRQFRIGELPFDESQRHTVRRVLREMEELGYLTRESKRSATWEVSEEAMLILDVDDDAGDRSGS